MSGTRYLVFAVAFGIFSVYHACFGGVVQRWSVETSEISEHEFECYRGETVEMQCQMLNYGKVVSGCGVATFLWQTNGMGNVWWSTNATCSSGYVKANWTPWMDVGGDSYRFFFQVVDSKGANYRANGRIGIVGSPYGEAHDLPLPAKEIDFGRVTVLNATNAPWVLDVRTNGVSAVVGRVVDLDLGGSSSGCVDGRGVTNIIYGVFDFKVVKNGTIQRNCIGTDYRDRSDARAVHEHGGIYVASVVTNRLYDKGSLWVTANPTGSWTLVTDVPAFGTNYIRKITYGNGKWVGVAKTDGMWWSSNGTTWNHVSDPELPDCTDVAYNEKGGKFYASSYDGIYTSADGMTWVSVTNGSWRSVATAGGGLVVAGSAGDGGLWYSSDAGLTWGRSNVTNGEFRAIGSDGGSFVAGAYTNDAGAVVSGLYRSADGKVWEKVHGEARFYYAIRSRGGLWAACSAGKGKDILASSGGREWYSVDGTKGYYLDMLMEDDRWVMGSGWKNVRVIPVKRVQSSVCTKEDAGNIATNVFSANADYLLTNKVISSSVLRIRSGEIVTANYAGGSAMNVVIDVTGVPENRSVDSFLIVDTAAAGTMIVNTFANGVQVPSVVRKRKSSEPLTVKPGLSCYSFTRFRCRNGTNEVYVIRNEIE